ncbi:MAG: 30S ribosomal protein S18 [Planctomycetes bacterium]|nr:30S ribosomal protein S18 [Planctomycetota bacterium]
MAREREEEYESRGGEGRSEGKGSRGKPRRARPPTACRFCTDRVGDVDYKSVDSLRKLMSIQAKLFSRKRSGVCSAHQHSLKMAVKRARYLALIPYC